MRRSLVLIALGLAVGFLAGATIRPAFAGLIYDGVEIWTEPSDSSGLLLRLCREDLRTANADWDALPGVVKYLFGPAEE